ncbi:MAG: hypothetical protein HY903_03480 [Deltaproteobacteria bacterium]|nr:hypothetical protein [Deltaproteobacteria bacterium]
MKTNKIDGSPKPLDPTASVGQDATVARREAGDVKLTAGDAFDAAPGTAVVPNAGVRDAAAVATVRDALLENLAAARAHLAAHGAEDLALASFEWLDAAHGFVALGKFDAALKTLSVATRGLSSEATMQSACLIAAEAYLGKGGSDNAKLALYEAMDARRVSAGPDPYVETLIARAAAAARVDPTLST